jgi:hypothetical protein
LFLVDGVADITEAGEDESFAVLCSMKAAGVGIFRRIENT